MASEAQLLQKFRTGLITLQTRLSALPYIGNYLTAKLQAQNIDTVQDLVNRARNKSTRQVHDLLTLLAANQRANQCVRGNYHVRDVNKAGYTTLRNTLAAVRTHWARYANSLPLPPAEPVDRDQSTAVCSCISDRAECERMQRNRVCQWRRIGRGGEERCIPRRAGAAPAFEGVDGRAGQRREQGAQPPNARFFDNWRIPDNR